MAVTRNSRAPRSDAELGRDGLIRSFEEVDADEVMCWPTIAELDQVDLLADLVTTRKDDRTK